MPSLKDYIRSLFKLSCNQTLPSMPSVQTAVVDSAWHSLVSPCDGYAMLTSTAGEPGAFEVVFSDVGFDAKSASTPVGNAIAVPIKKGSQFGYRVSNAQNSPTVQIRFFPFTGAV